MIQVILCLIIWSILRLQLAHALRSGEDDGYDIEIARLTEARRRLRMLGELVEGEYDYRKFRDRSKQTLLPMPLLKAWHEAYRATGLGGLQPDWQPLNESSYSLALQRRTLLGELADVDVISDEDIKTLAAKLDWRESRAREWLLRFRRGGLWALAPEHYPHNVNGHRRNGPNTPPRMPGSLFEKDLAEIERRTLRLGWLLEKLEVTDNDVQKRAKEIGCSPRTLWYNLGRHRKYGPLGLARDERSDKGGRHTDDWYTDIIVACRLTKKDATVNWVYEEVCRRARHRGMLEPSYWRVRSVCEEINGYFKAIADGREDDFRNRFRFAGRLKIEGVVYEIDHTQVDVLVKDIRSKRIRAKSSLIRPWLTTVVEGNSRLLVAAVFSYDKPDRFTVAEAIRRALVVSDEHPYGGIPAEIWIDRGKDLTSHHVSTICWTLGIKLHLTYCPEHKPHVERFFGTLNTRLWSEQNGYTGSSVDERNPTAERDADLTIAKLEEKFWEFISDRYHKEIHSELGVSPPQFWDENCFTEAADVRQLDVLMMEPENRRVTKGRISLDGRLYFHPDLATHVATSVLVRRPSHYDPSDTIEVYKNGIWICTAVALDSEFADDITAEDVRNAQRTQRQAARNKITQAEETLAVEDQEQTPASQEGASKPAEHKLETPIVGKRTAPTSPQSPAPGNTSKNDSSFLRSLGRQAKNRQEGEDE
jgi:putative transposase